ncbi:MAG: flagellar hook-length control protein FliK [Pseudomonadota bacterium]
MTHPLLSSPGNTAAQLQPVEHAAGNKNGKAGNNPAAQSNGNDFKTMVRELSSDGQPKTDAKAETTARSGGAAAEAQSQPKTPVTENAINASKIAVQRTSEANSEQIEEQIEDDPKLEKQGLAAQEDQEQAAGDSANGDEQNGLQQAKQVATPVAAEEDDELIPEDEEGLSEEYELDATAELPGDNDDEGSPSDVKAAEEDPEASELPTQDTASTTDDQPQIDSVANSQPQAAVQQGDGEVEVRPTERQPAQQPVQPPARPEDALRASLQRINAATTPTDADGQPATTAVDPKASAQAGEVSRLASTVNPAVEPAGQSDTATKPTVVQHSQISLTDGQLRAIQNATTVAQSRAQTIEGSQVQSSVQVPEIAGGERLPPASDARLGLVNGDLQALLREPRAADNVAANALPRSGPATTGANPDVALIAEDDELSEGRLLSAMQDGDLLRRVAAVTGAQVDRSNFETALSVSRQLSQGVVGAISVWVGAASSQPLGSSSAGSSGDFMGGRGPASDLNIRPVGQPPGELRTIRLQLQPASLGTVTAQLTMKNDELHVKFVVERAETSELIQSQRNLLLAQLVEAGVEVNSANVEVETARTNGARGSAVHPGLSGGSNEFVGGAFGSADGQNRSASSERDGLTDQAAVDDDAANNESADQSTQRPSVVYL